MDLVSVILPVYNTEEYIEGAIGSVIAQTYQNMEIIVVDDGSQDRSIELARKKLENEFGGSWRILSHETNKGVSAARNTGIKAAKGAWLQFMDGDDFMAPQKIEKQMAACATAPEDVAAVYSPFQVVHVEDGKLIPVKTMFPELEGKHPLFIVAGMHHVVHWACLFRKTAVDKAGGFNEAYPWCECMDMMVRILQDGYRYIPVAMDAPLYFWRWYPDQPRVGGAGARYKLGQTALIYLEIVRRAAGKLQWIDIPLAEVDRAHLLEECTKFARLLYISDRQVFKQYMRGLLEFYPDFLPSGPWYLTRLARWIGYENAEAVAALARGPKGAVRSLLRRA
jgi:glycosyltransferase involved in cell wall biosynthesis